MQMERRIHSHSNLCFSDLKTYQWAINNYNYNYDYFDLLGFILPKRLIEPPGPRECKKQCSNSQDHMTKIVATSQYSRSFEKNFFISPNKLSKSIILNGRVSKFFCKSCNFKGYSKASL